jgi:curli biogenesis system outer membrane secretion channel CsgG
MKNILATLLLFFMVSSNAFAATIEQGAKVAVMDFGTHPHAVTIDINILNAGKAAHEYILQRLFESHKMDIMDRTMFEAQLAAQNLNTTGLIYHDTAQKIGKILGVDYIIYGNVNDVTLSEIGTQIGIGGVTVCTVKSHIIARVMNVESGEIISAAKGEGKSKSSFVKVKGGAVLTVEVGNTKVTQDSVHNAIQQAAFQTVDVLIGRLYGNAK